MKRLAGLVLLLTTIGLIGSLLIRNLKPSLTAIDFLPRDTLALMEWNDFARSWERWQRSSLAGKLNDPELPRILAQMGVPDLRIAEFKAVKAFVDQFTSTSLFTGLLSNTSVLALLPGSRHPAVNSIDPLNHLVLIVPSGSEFSPRQLERFFGTVQSTGTSVYQGVPLVTFTFASGRAFTFCQYRGRVLCALDPEPVQRCIDQARERMVRAHTGLQANPDYQRLKKHAVARADFFVYADLAALRKQLPGIEIEENADRIIPHHLAFYHRADAEHDRLAIVAQVPLPQLATFTSRYRLASPVEDPMSRQVSPETRMYLWTNWFAPKVLWNFGLGMRNHEVGALVMLLAQNLIEGTGKSTDEFFDVFGNRFGVLITEQQGLSPSNRSMSCLSVEVRDQQEVELMLKRLLAGLQVIKVVTGGMEISSVIMAGGLLQPSYALVDKHLILADTVELIEQVQRPGELASAGGDGVVVPAIARTGNFFLFVRTGDVADQWIAILTVLAREKTDLTRRLTQQTRLLIEHAAIPLLTSLQGAATTRLRGSAADDEVMLEMDFSSDSERR
jgi:hypothetical protein